VRTSSLTPILSVHWIRLQWKIQFCLGVRLDCFDYIAWGPSEPRDRLADEDCAVLSSNRQWGVTRCSTRMPYLCEMWPGGDQAAETATRLTKCAALQNPGYLQYLCLCLFQKIPVCNLKDML
jgi:hypothetical protein